MKIYFTILFILLFISGCINRNCSDKAILVYAHVIDIYKIEKQKTAYRFNHKKYNLKQLDDKLIEVKKNSNAVFFIICGPNYAHKYLLNILALLHKHEIKNIYINVDESIKAVLTDNKIKYDLNYPRINILHAKRELNKVQNSKKLYDYIFRNNKLNPDAIPVVTCSPDIQFYWLKDIITGINYQCKTGFFITERANIYKIKSLISLSCAEAHNFLFTEAPELPAPPEY